MSSFEDYFQLDIVGNMQKNLLQNPQRKSCFSYLAVTGKKKKKYQTPAMSPGSEV